jgi:predicted amidohydrolase YtcJ
MSQLTADLIIANARALTSDPSRPRAEALAVRASRIVYVGDTAGALALRGPATRVVDAGGATLLPGIVDSHYHLLRGSLKLDGIQLGQVSSCAELEDALRAYARQHQDAPWLAGYGLRYQALAGLRAPVRAGLDAIVPDRPLLLLAFDGHTAWANTRALALGGVLQGAACGPNSEVVIGADGLAEGELREPGAFGPLEARIPAPAPARARALLREGLAQAAALGITSVHNMDGDMAQLQRYRELEAGGELTLRVYCPYSVEPHTRLEDLAEAVAMRVAASGPLVRAGCVKFFMDGVVEGYTGLLLDDYAGPPGVRGDANYSAEHFNQMAIACDRLGLQIFVHAIGDAAVRRALDGFAAARDANGPRDSRHRVEHIELIHPDDLPRFRALGAIASMQPYHAPVPPDYGPVWLARVGRERWRRSFAWGHLHAAGARLAFGSDWPVVSQSPWLGLHAAVARRPWLPGLPSQALPLEAALAAYTSGGAYAERQEREKGMLRAGMLADLVVLSDDITKLTPEDIPRVSAALTVCDGRVVYEG